MWILGWLSECELGLAMSVRSSFLNNSDSLFAPHYLYDLFHTLNVTSIALLHNCCLQHILFHTFSRVTAAFLILPALSAVGAVVADVTAVAVVVGAEVEVLMHTLSIKLNQYGEHLLVNSNEFTSNIVYRDKYIFAATFSST